MIFLKRLWPLLPACILMASCALDPKKEALASYVNQEILAIAIVEKEAFERYATVTDENYTTNQAVYETLKDEVIPLYKRFSHLLNGIRIKDEEVAKIHGLYLKGSRKILKGFELKLHGIAWEDEAVIIHGNQKINEGIQITYQWREQILALRDSRGLKGKTQGGARFENFLKSVEEMLLRTQTLTY